MPGFTRFCLLALAALTPGVAAAQVVAAEQASANAAGADTDPASQTKQIIDGANTFSLDLFKQVRQPDQNLFVSPASVSTAVSFAYRGAVGQTAQELATVLHFPLAPRPNLQAMGPVLDTMEIAGEGRELHAANAIWTQTGMPLGPYYESDMATYAKAGLQRVNFRADPEAARLSINRWVGGVTRDNIPNLLAQGIITIDTRAVLVNAIYFKVDWLRQFRKEATKPELFTSLEGAKTSIPLMNQQNDFQVLHRSGVKAIQLPYVGGEVSLVVFLPDRPDALPSFENKLTAERLNDWLAALDKAKPQDTILTLPKMKLRWGKDLKGELAAMGAPIAFSDDADFSAMAKLPYPGEDPHAVGLKIAHIIHEATLDVDETGSEAAAATAVVMNIIVTGARRGPPPPPPFIFRADKPFLFALRDNRTGLILFMGRYVKPSAPEQ